MASRRSLTYYAVSGASLTDLGNTAPTNVGTYIVVASYPRRRRYCWHRATASFTITPATLTITATSDSKVYDGTTTDSAAPTFQVAGEPVDTLYGSDTITGLIQAFTSKDVLGANLSTLVVTGYTINDDDDGANYRVTLVSAQGTITPAALTISATSQTKVYDGTTTSTAAPTYSGLITVGGDTITGLSQAFASKNVLGTNGSTLAVTGYTINDGDGGKDYTVTLHTASGTITPAALTISASEPDQGLRRHDDLDGRPDLFRTDHRRRRHDHRPEPRRSRPRTCLGPMAARCWSPATRSTTAMAARTTRSRLHTATGTITPAALTISATSQTKVYDGTTTSTAVTDRFRLITVGGDTITGLSQAFASKNVLGTNGSTLPGHRLHGQRRRRRQ